MKGGTNLVFHAFIWVMKRKIQGNHVHKGCWETSLAAATLSTKPLLVHLAQNADFVSSLRNENSSVKLHPHRSVHEIQCGI